MRIPDTLQRQKLMWGEEKVAVLQSAHVVIAGLGGLGCVVASQLARSGVGTLTLIDDSLVEIPDLGRQLLYLLDDLGQPKVQVAAKALTAAAPLVEVHALQKTIHPLGSFIHHYGATAFADCVDNYLTRFALEAQLPQGAFLVHGGVQEERGQIVTVVAGSPPSLQHIFFGVYQPPSPVAVLPQGCSIVGGYQSLTILTNLWWEAGLLPASSFRQTLRGNMMLLDLVSGINAHIALQ